MTAVNLMLVRYSHNAARVNEYTPLRADRTEAIK